MDIEEAKTIKFALKAYADTLEESIEETCKNIYSKDLRNVVRKVLIGEVEIMRRTAFNVTFTTIVMEKVKKKWGE